MNTKDSQKAQKRNLIKANHQKEDKKSDNLLRHFNQIMSIANKLQQGGKIEEQPEQSL